MAPTSNIFWCKVVFQKFIKHYRKLNDDQIIRDVRQSMDDLEDLVPDSDTFGSQMVRWALERAEEPFATAARNNGKKGGRPRKNSKSTAAGNDQVPAGDATRGDAVDSINSASDGVILGSTTVSGKNYAEEGANGNAALNITTVRKNGALESGTSSANIQGPARPQKTGAGASQAPLQISPLENRAPSPTIANRSDKKQPVNIGAAAPAPPLGSLDCHNREPQAPSPEASSITGDVMSFAYAGRNGLVRLTQDEYNQVIAAVGNIREANRLIDSFDYKLAEGYSTAQPHVNVLLHWQDWREDVKETRKAGGYKSSAEKSSEAVRQIGDYYEGLIDGAAAGNGNKKRIAQ